MNGWAWWTGSAAIVISLCGLPAGAVATGMVQFAQKVSDAPREATAPGRPPIADVPALPANSPEQIRKAQIELKRLDCLQGRIDGKLGNETRQAVTKFWASAKRPAVDVSITDGLISELAERGDNFCRPPRPFFGFGGRPGGNSALPFFAPGVRPSPLPGPLPGAAAQPLPPAASQ
jgi:peptidoglycan hydrolase-like protein with peptidoglycan-binding domain